MYAAVAAVAADVGHRGIYYHASAAGSAYRDRVAFVAVVVVGDDHIVRATVECAYRWCALEVAP